LQLDFHDRGKRAKKNAHDEVANRAGRINREIDSRLVDSAIARFVAKCETIRNYRVPSGEIDSVQT
jgi:hypothetical protein